jgi:hypothetical protein
MHVLPFLIWHGSSIYKPETRLAELSGQELPWGYLADLGYDLVMKIDLTRFELIFAVDFAKDQSTESS